MCCLNLTIYSQNCERSSKKHLSELITWLSEVFQPASSVLAMLRTHNDQGPLSQPGWCLLSQHFHMEPKVLLTKKQTEFKVLLGKAFIFWEQNLQICKSYCCKVRGTNSSSESLRLIVKGVILFFLSTGDTALYNDH